MLCDRCAEREATVQLTKVINSAVTQLHLCEKCAAAEGIEPPLTTPKHPLAGILQEAQSQVMLPSDAARCAYCGTSQKDFRATGRLGCAHCYGAFAEALRDLLRRVHGKPPRHVGRRYHPPDPAAADRAGSIAMLQERLRQAVEHEDFEVAAGLRDEIRGLE